MKCLPLGDDAIPDVGLDEGFLPFSGDLLDVWWQPPLDAMTIERHRFCPELIAVTQDRLDVDHSDGDERPEAAVASDVGEFEVVAGADEGTLPRMILVC